MFDGVACRRQCKAVFIQQVITFIYLYAKNIVIYKNEVNDIQYCYILILLPVEKKNIFKTLPTTFFGLSYTLRKLDSIYM